MTEALLTDQLLVPLNKLRFGHEAPTPINARVVGREDNIAALAANLHAEGQLENLLVKDFDDGFYYVSNGNRRLAALHMIHGRESDFIVRCTPHPVDAAGAFEHSLTTAVTAEQLHPVDQYEAFAKLEQNGLTIEEIARRFGMSEKQVRQALALGRLSAKIRNAWRADEIKRSVAESFTLAADHKTQDKVFEKLKKSGYLWEGIIKKELGAGNGNDDVAPLLDLVGAEAYRARGGVVTEDLFGTSHIIGDEALLKRMADEVIQAQCDKLRADGWAWAELLSTLPQGARWWNRSDPKDMIFEADEQVRLEKMRSQLKAMEDSDDYDEDLSEKLTREFDDLESAVIARSFDSKKRAKLGCIVDIDDGRLTILYGVKKPAEVSEPGSSPGSAAAKKKAKGAEAAGPEISNALLERLSVQLTQAAATALIQDEQLALCVLLAGIGCYDDCGAKVSINGMGARGLDERGLLGSEEMPKALALAQRLKPAERITLLAQAAANALDFRNARLDTQDKEDGPLAICNTIDPKAFNAAMRGAFDAKDYFAGVSKALCLKAIEEAMGPDHARQQGKNPKGEIAEFAVANVPPTGWLPPQLRVKGYDGPPKAKPVAAAPAAKKTPAKAKTAKPAAKKKTAKKSKR